MSQIVQRRLHIREELHYQWAALQEIGYIGLLFNRKHSRGDKLRLQAALSNANFMLMMSQHGALRAYEEEQ